MGHPHCKTQAWGRSHTYILKPKCTLIGKGGSASWPLHQLQTQKKPPKINVCGYYSFTLVHFTQWQQFYEHGN